MNPRTDTWSHHSSILIFRFGRDGTEIFRNEFFSDSFSEFFAPPFQLFHEFFAQLFRIFFADVCRFGVQCVPYRNQNRHAGVLEHQRAVGSFLWLRSRNDSKSNRIACGNGFVKGSLNWHSHSSITLNPAFLSFSKKVFYLLPPHQVLLPIWMAFGHPWNWKTVLLFWWNSSRHYLQPIFLLRARSESGGSGCLFVRIVFRSRDLLSRFFCQEERLFDGRFGRLHFSFL